MSKTSNSSASKTRALKSATLSALGMLFLLFVAVLAERSLPYSLGTEIVLGFLQRALLVGFIAAVAFGVVIVLMRPSTWKTGALLLWLVLLVPLDPYSWGLHDGTWEGETTHLWQIFPAIGSVLMLLVTIRWMAEQEWKTARLVLSMETSLFVIANVIYLLRDGPHSRFFEETLASPTPLISLVVGVLVRSFCLITFSQSSRSP